MGQSCVRKQKGGTYTILVLMLISIRGSVADIKKFKLSKYTEILSTKLQLFPTSISHSGRGVTFHWCKNVQPVTES